MGSSLSKLIRFGYAPDSRTGLKIVKILNTHRRSIIRALRIQPAGNLLAAGDDFGTLLFFDLTRPVVDPQQSRHLLQEQGGISELCWLADDFIAVGTTRGRIIIFSSRNSRKRFDYVCAVDAHGDGVTRVAVESLAYAATTSCLASVGEGKIGVRLWSIDNGIISEQATGDQSPEFTPPRFVAFSRNGAELVVGYLEQKIMGNAVLLPRSKQLAVFNLRNGLDIYNFPELHGKREAQFTVDPLTRQGVAALQAGSLLACPTTDGRINIIDCNAAVVGSLCYKNRASFNVIDSLSVPGQRTEILAGAYSHKNETRVVIWQSESPARRSGTPPSTQTYDSLALRILTGVLIYLFCAFLQPLIASIVLANLKGASAAIRNVEQFQSTATPISVPVEREGSWL